MNDKAIEAAAQAMCDRVNGQGDYAENIGQRRSGWVAQAQAGIAAYLAALATPKPPVDAGAMRSAVQAEIDRLKGADSPWAVGIRDRLTAAIRSQSDAGEPL